MRSLFRSLLLSTAIVATSWSAASAHEQAVAFTDVLIKAIGSEADCSIDGCQIEVAHRLAIHDAESTLMGVLGARADLYGDREAQSMFEAYVADRFTISDAASGEQIDLTLLGGEVERGFYWVYLEGALPAETTEIDVSNTVMMDAIPRQTNRVNVRHMGQTQTLVFSGGARPKTYRIR